MAITVGHKTWLNNDLDFGEMTFGQGHDIPFIMDNNCGNYHVNPIYHKQEAQRATVAHLSTMNAREILEWNQK